MEDYVKCYGNLQQELNEAKHTLDSLNDSIRQIVGRRQDSCRSDRIKPFDSKKSERQNARYNDFVKQKKRINNEAKSVFNRLSTVIERNEPEIIRPRVNSRIIRELPTRQEIVDAQGTDLESRARNRRMFGSLLGTLHKFCQEESRLKQKEEKKAKIEKKLEEQELKEREKIRKRRELLFLDRKQKQLEIKSLEYKLSQLSDYKVWENSMMNLRYSIKTKSKPHIYFKPNKLSKKTEKLLAESRSALEKRISTKKEALNKELLEFDKSVKLDAIPDDEEVKCLTNEKTPETITVKSCSDTSPNEAISNRGNSDYKENKSGNLSESVISSSICVVTLPKIEPLNN